MKTVNKVTLLGYVGADPEVRSTPQGAVVASFSVATTERWKSEGAPREETTWHRCVAWGKLGELAEQLLHKGAPVYLEGRLRVRSYTDKHDVERIVTEIVCEEFSALAKREDASAQDSDRRTRGNAHERALA